MHNSRLFQESELVDKIKNKESTFTRKFAIYGDSAYAKSDYLMKPFSRLKTASNALKRQQNFAMSGVRQAVKWGFKEVVSKFPFLEANEVIRKTS